LKIKVIFSSRTAFLDILVNKKMIFFQKIFGIIPLQKPNRTLLTILDIYLEKINMSNIFIAFPKTSL